MIDRDRYHGDGSPRGASPRRVTRRDRRLTNRRMTLEASAPRVGGRKSRRVRRHEWVPA